MDAPTPTEIATLATDLGIQVDDATAEQYASEISDGFDWYEVLDGFDIGSSTGPGSRFDSSGTSSTSGRTRTPPRSPFFDPEFSAVTSRHVEHDPGAETDPFNAFITTFDCVLDDPPRETLNDVSVAVKDNIAVAGVPMTCGTALLQDCLPEWNSTVVERLLRNGATLVGKTNMDELAIGGTGETGDFGPTPNPRDEGCVAGGSSSGSGAAVAAGLADAALGSDSAGSVRIPASFCDVVGFKPSRGTISRAGYVDLIPTLDHIGILAHDVQTATTVFDVIAGADAADSLTVPDDLRILRGSNRHGEASMNLEASSFCVPRTYVERWGTDAVIDSFDEAIRRIEESGATVDNISIPTLRPAVGALNVIVATEFYRATSSFGITVHRWKAYDLRWHDQATSVLTEEIDRLGSHVHRLLLEGRHVFERTNGQLYAKAQSLRALLADEFATLLGEYDAMLTPTTPVSEIPLEECGTGDDEQDAPIGIYCRPANLTGGPALSVPVPSSGRRPTSIQVIGGQFADESVLDIGEAIEGLRAG